MEILSGHGLGPNLQRILQPFCTEQAVVMKAGILFEWTFSTERGETQGDLVSITTFNIVVHAVVRAVMLEVCGPQEAYHGLGWASVEHNIVLYVDYSGI